MAFFRKKSLKEMFISTPSPYMFGNQPNTPTTAGWTEENWLKSQFHFSFAEWASGPSSFGPLRVVNDDLVQPKRGFGTHPHRNMEIFTYVVSGGLTHEDSMGNSETLGKGSIQYMSAGNGVMHSEYNHGDVPARFLQMWAKPRAQNLPPRYGSFDMSKEKKSLPLNQVVLLIDDLKREGATEATTRAFLHQDLRFSVAFVTEEISYPLLPSRALYIISVEGEGVFKKESEELWVGEGEAVMVGGVEGGVRGVPSEGLAKAWHVVFVEVGM